MRIFSTRCVVFHVRPGSSDNVCGLTTLPLAARMPHIPPQLMNPAQPWELRRVASARWTAVRVLVVSVLATLIDYGAVGLLIALLKVAVPVATLIGCVLGGVVAFVTARSWAFSGRGAWLTQAWRYALVSGSSAVLNAGGVALVLLLPELENSVAWWLTRAFVWSMWTLPLTRNWAFGSNPRGKALM